MCVHSQGVVYPRDELNQELWRDRQPRAYAFVAPDLLPRVAAYTHPAGQQRGNTIVGFESVKQNRQPEGTT